MAYIGSPPASQAFAPGTDTFSGNGSQTAFALSRNVGTVNDILVVVNNVDQQPTAYTVSVSTLTFTAAPSAGTNNIYVRYLSTNLQTIAPQQGSVTKQALDVASGGLGTGAVQLPTGTTAQRPSATVDGYTRFNTTTGLLEFWDGSAWASGGGGGSVTPADVSDQANTSTGYFDIPSGTTAQRPVSTTTGALRYNTTLGYPEWYDGTTWWPFSEAAAYNLEYLVVAGGGGGGQQGGGGGAGGFRTASGFPISLGSSYTVTVGAGGAANTTGSNSVFSTVTSAGGGNGGRAAGGSINGASGGSGGGAAVTSSTGTGGTGNTPSVTPAQGTNGGVNATTSGFGGGGGGGASAAGANGTTTAGGAGGAGTASSITGTSVYYAGGGGAGLFVAGTPGAGGVGGGGTGAVTTGTGTAGTANTGGGGGGNGASSGTVGAGGSGVVILKYLAAFNLTAGAGLTVSTVTSGAYKVSTFTAGTGTISFS